MASELPSSFKFPLQDKSQKQGFTILLLVGDRSLVFLFNYNLIASDSCLVGESFSLFYYRNNLYLKIDNS